MWTDENRGRYDRSKLRYPSDLTDEEWAHVEPLIPPAKRGGAQRTVKLREAAIAADLLKPFGDGQSLSMNRMADEQLLDGRITPIATVLVIDDERRSLESSRNDIRGSLRRGA